MASGFSFLRFAWSTRNIMRILGVKSMAHMSRISFGDTLVPNIE